MLSVARIALAFDARKSIFVASDSIVDGMKFDVRIRLKSMVISRRGKMTDCAPVDASLIFRSGLFH